MRRSVIKRTKGILFALIYLAIYYVVSAAVQFVYVLYQQYSRGASLSQIESSVTNGMYALSVISAIISFWIYLIIGKFRKKRIDAVISTRKMPLMVNAMAAILAVGLRLVVTVYYSYSQNVELLKKSIDEASMITPQFTSGFQILVAIFSIIVIAPLFEEILFRGLIMNELCSSVRVWLAIILQAILFGVAHAVLFQSIFAFLIGLMLGIIYHVTKSIKTSVICHGVFNFSVILTGNTLTNTSAIVIALLGILLCVCSLSYIIANGKQN